MSKHKSNVHPGYYKVAGRERQGEDIVHDRQKSMLTQNRADLEHREPYPQWPAPTEKKPMPESPSTQAGEFVREEMHHIREGKHGARSTKQAIAIGLSKARRVGVKLGSPSTGSRSTRQKAARDSARGRHPRKPSATRARAVRNALKREGHSAASRGALARQARSSARRRTATQRSSAARKAARTRARS